MTARPNRRTLWLVGVAVLLAAATALDYGLFGSGAGSSRPKPGGTPERAQAPTKPPAKATPKAAAPQQTEPQAAAPAPKSAPGQTVKELRERLAYLRAVEKSAPEVRKAYGEVAIPYAEAMAPLPTFFVSGSDPKSALEGAVRGLAGGAGLTIDSLLVGAPQRVGTGVYEGAATITVRGGDSGAMLRFFAEAGRPGNGMVWNGFLLTADEQSRQLTLAGELRVLLVESAE